MLPKRHVHVHEPVVDERGVLAQDSCRCTQLRQPLIESIFKTIRVHDVVGAFTSLLPFSTALVHPLSDADGRQWDHLGHRVGLERLRQCEGDGHVLDRVRVGRRHRVPFWLVVDLVDSQIHVLQERVFVVSGSCERKVVGALQRDEGLPREGVEDSQPRHPNVSHPNEHLNVMLHARHSLDHTSESTKFHFIEL
eukprot:2655570-Rhodomonas_salina.2